MLEDALNILLIEDNHHDQELVKGKIKKAFPNSVFTVAKNKSTFLEKVKWAIPDLIVSDYHLPDYNGLNALLFSKEHLPEVPFLLISGPLNNKEAIASTILNCASAYVLKENLDTLPDKLLKIYSDNKHKKALQQKKKEGTRRLFLHLQKAKSLLDSSPVAFEKKSKISAEIEEALKYII